MRIIITLLLLSSPWFAVAQGHGFPFGKVTLQNLTQKMYDRDTTAKALMLDEFGEAYVDNGGNHNLIFEHHYKIKILKAQGLELSNFSMPLIKYNSQSMEILREVKASSFSIVDGVIKESKLNAKNIFTEHYEEGDIKKFAIPNVMVGSVIEIQYKIERPNMFNFQRWEFQSDIPKVRSEYWATIPANYSYNIALKGFLRLSKNESELMRDCFTPGGNSADCSRMKFAMENIPAFVEEEYMTARENYLSSINFELSEIKYFRGGVDKITKEWRDVEEELRRDQRFGVQLKRGEDIVGEAAEQLLTGQKDSLAKAKIIYDFIVNHYVWNREFSKYCDQGIKKAFDAKTGNVGDINLSLIAALRYAGFLADPVILSTRDNGFVTELYPVLSDFNYVIAKLTVQGKTYLLDATDHLLPFGMIPFRCLNGKGRVIGDKRTSWQEIVPENKFRKMSYVTLRFDEEGNWSGTIQNVYVGYEAYLKRKEVLSFNNVEAYQQSIEGQSIGVTIHKLDMKNLEEIAETLIENIECTLEGPGDVSSFLFNPFELNKRESNPFKSSERLYPVDFGSTIDERIVVTLQLPAYINVVDPPQRVALALPNNGGKFIFDVKNDPHTLVISTWLNLSRPVFSSEEYHYLKELFSRIVQIQNTDLIFRKS